MSISILKPGYRWRSSNPKASLFERLREAACWAVHNDDEHEWDKDGNCECGIQKIEGFDES